MRREVSQVGGKEEADGGREKGSVGQGEKVSSTRIEEAEQKQRKRERTFDILVKVVSAIDLLNRLSHPDRTHLLFVLGDVVVLLVREGAGVEVLHRVRSERVIRKMRKTARRGGLIGRETGVARGKEKTTHLHEHLEQLLLLRLGSRTGILRLLSNHPSVKLIILGVNVCVEE